MHAYSFLPHTSPPSPPPLLDSKEQSIEAVLEAIASGAFADPETGKTDSGFAQMDQIGMVSPASSLKKALGGAMPFGSCLWDDVASPLLDIIARLLRDPQLTPSCIGYNDAPWPQEKGCKHRNPHGKPMRATWCCANSGCLCLCTHCAETFNHKAGMKRRHVENRLPCPNCGVLAEAFHPVTFPFELPPSSAESAAAEAAEAAEAGATEAAETGGEAAPAEEADTEADSPYDHSAEAEDVDEEDVEGDVEDEVVAVDAGCRVSKEKQPTAVFMPFNLSNQPPSMAVGKSTCIVATKLIGDSSRARGGKRKLCMQTRGAPACLV